MYQYYIQTKNSKNEYKFEKREGYQLPNNFAACQEQGRWTISDVLSGANVVKNAAILKDAKVQLEKLIPQVEEIRKSELYASAVKRLKQYVYLLPETKRINGWKRYFKNL